MTLLAVAVLVAGCESSRSKIDHAKGEAALATLRSSIDATQDLRDDQTAAIRAFDMHRADMKTRGAKCGPPIGGAGGTPSSGRSAGDDKHNV